jgi:hypothetical protein
LPELLIRFLIGGTLVSAFATLGDIFKPKSFAGLFGAAPSIALATISLTLAEKTKAYVGTEVRSMILGAIAFVLGASLVPQLLLRTKWPTFVVSAVSLGVWLLTSFALYRSFLP